MHETYDPKVTPWEVNEENFPRDAGGDEQFLFLVRYAVLAPSNHNAQPWKFAVSEDRIHVFVDKARWLRVADADQRGLHLSVGCALENLLIAAEHFGFGARVAHVPTPGNEELAAEVRLAAGGKPSAFRPARLFKAIPMRHTNHKTYDAKVVPETDLKHLAEAVVEDGITLHIISDVETRRRLDELVVEGDARQFSDAGWREELAHWIGQGVFGASWLISKTAQLATTHMNLAKGLVKKDTDLLMGAPLVGVIGSRVDDRVSQIKAGQVLERIALAATCAGVRIQPMSQILEVPDLKAEVGKLLPGGAYPQITFRLGYAVPEKEHTPRRPLEEVLA
jgi:nitroreductase